MDIVQFFQDLANKYDADLKCGFCWQFGAPLTEEGMNKQQIDQDSECCAHIFLIEYVERSEYRYNASTGLNNYEACLMDFTIYVGLQVEDIGQNVYNEIAGHPVSAGLWEQIFKPLKDCLGCGKELYLCELGYDFDITKWISRKVHFKDDKNFTGWRIDGTFRIKK